MMLTDRARYSPPQRRRETRAPQQKRSGTPPGAAPTTITPTTRLRYVLP